MRTRGSFNNEPTELELLVAAAEDEADRHLTKAEFNFLREAYLRRVQRRVRKVRRPSEPPRDS